jgi:cell division septation protein DedD
VRAVAEQVLGHQLARQEDHRREDRRQGELPELVGQHQHPPHGVVTQVRHELKDQVVPDQDRDQQPAFVAHQALHQARAAPACARVGLEAHTADAVEARLGA